MTSITQDGKVEFKFFRPGVRAVRLVGDFNQWDPAGLAMTSSGDGWWTALLDFDAGDYRFRYLADGEWFNDYAAYGLEMTKTGFNSVIRVPRIMGAKYQNTLAKQVA